jgi:GNAT superfamily N-acetyltransferase
MIRITYLADAPHWVPTLARWFYAQWWDLHPGSTPERYLESVGRRLNVGAIPTAFVALAGQTLVGSASLVSQDLETHPHLSPWLASVYVHPDYRRQGIGSMLVQRVVAEARDLRVERLYLFTPDKGAFYARLGWRLIERPELNGQPVDLMSIAP